MFRALFFLLRLSLLAAIFIWFAERPGTVVLNWQGYEIETSVGFAAGVLGLGVLALILADRLWRAVIVVPAQVRRWRAQQARDAGYDEITKGLVAVAAGDARQAGRHARRARALLPDAPLTGLLNAASAASSGDAGAARLAFENLLDDKRVAFFGLRGLLTQTLTAGDHDGALELARRAEALHPRQGWILKTLFDLEVRARHWLAALALMPRLRRFSGLEPARALRMEQTLLLALCEETSSRGDTRGALKLARRAFALNPGFVPASLRVAELFHRLGKRRAAVSAIKTGWTQTQHPDLAELWVRVAPVARGKTQALRQKAEVDWVRALYDLAPFSVYAKRALGQAALAADMWEEARVHLHEAGDFRALARLEKAQTGSESRVREWLELAADAPPPQRWICGQCGHGEFSWGPACPSCHAFDALSWDTPGLRYQDHGNTRGGEFLPPPVI